MSIKVKESKLEAIHRLAIENVVIPLIELMEELEYIEFRSKEGGNHIRLSELKSIANRTNEIPWFESKGSTYSSGRTCDTDENFMEYISNLQKAIKNLREFSLKLENKIKELEETPMILTRTILFEKAIK